VGEKKRKTVAVGPSVTFHLSGRGQHCREEGKGKGKELAEEHTRHGTDFSSLPQRLRGREKKKGRREHIREEGGLAARRAGPPALSSSTFHQADEVHSVLGGGKKKRK